MLAKLAAMPRVDLITRGTPLVNAPRLAAAIGVGRLLVKRDDLAGVGLGGNKGRKLEYLAADALAQDADTLVTVGGIQSNHVRQTASVAARIGLRCEAVLTRVLDDVDDAYRSSGNVLLDGLFGATLHHPETLSTDASAEERLDALCASLVARGHRPYCIGLGGSDAIGTLGYVSAGLELAAQCVELGVEPAALILATGSGGTHAGLLLGFALAGFACEVRGIGVMDRNVDAHARVLGPMVAASSLLGLSAPDARAIRVTGDWDAGGYGRVDAATVDAIRLAARTEGLVLDPVYTGKAMAALVALCRRGEFGSGDALVFLHTGGSPGLFAYAGLLPTLSGDRPR